MSEVTEKPQVIIVIGSTNCPEGFLSPMAELRCLEAYDRWGESPSATVLTTGGSGLNFNESNRPHADILRDRLLSLGLPANRVHALEDCSNTVRDLVEVKKQLSSMFGKLELVSGLVITNQYHEERVNLILATVIFSGHKLDVVTPVYDEVAHIGEEMLGKLLEHENKCVRELKDQGGVYLRPEGPVFPFARMQRGPSVDTLPDPSADSLRHRFVVPAPVEMSP